MTRARSLKQVIRARAAKTGERYTTARRHVLANLRLASPPDRSQRQAPAPAGPPAKVKAPSTKGSVSDATSLTKTGYGLDHWFEVLDRFGAVEKGHTAAARHLFEIHGVDGWYSQGITVGYERARGLRQLNQRCDGAFEVSASKVVGADTAAVAKMFTDARLRRRWLANADARLAKTLATVLAKGSAKALVVKPNGQARLRLKFEGTIAQFYVDPKSSGKVTVTVQHTKLPSAAAVEERRVQWRSVLASIASVVA